MDMNPYKVREIIGDSLKFISPFSEPCGYYISEQDNEKIDAAEIEAYWSKLKYMSENVDILVQQAFKPVFFEFYGVDRIVITSPSEMCQQLVVESFVFNTHNKTIGCYLSNPQFMVGHYIDCLWSDHWELLYSDIC